MLLTDLCRTPSAASSGPCRRVLVPASVRLAEPPGTVLIVEESVAAAAAAPIDTIAMVPATCSTDCAAQAITVSTTTTLPLGASGSSLSSASPTTSATNDLFSTELATDIDNSDHDASLDNISVNSDPASMAPAISLTVGAHEDSTPSTKLAVPSSTTPTFRALVGALTSATPPTVSSAPTASTPLEVTATKSLKPFIVLGLGALGLAKCSTGYFDISVADITKRYVLVLQEAIKIGRRPPRPPPPLVLAYVLSELQHDKIQWQPWHPPMPMWLQREHQLSCRWSLPVEDVLRLRKSVEHGPGTIVADYPTTEILVVAAMSQNSGVTVVLGTVSQEEQFVYLLASLNILEKNLEKPCSESEEPILSGLIGRDIHPELLPLNDSVPCCVHQYSFALFQWEIAWKPKVKAECFDLGFHYCHVNIFEGCSSAYRPIVMLLYGNYGHLNSWASYTALYCTTASVVQICTLMYGKQRPNWGIISRAFLKCNYYICCWYALELWSLLVCIVYTYWLLHEQVSTGVYVLDMQCLMYKILVCLAVATNRRIKPMELFPGDDASRRYGCAKFQCIIFWMPYYHHCSHMRYQSAEDYCLHATKFAWKLIRFVVVTSHGKTVSIQKFKFGKHILANPHFHMAPTYKCLTLQDGNYVMARTTYYLNHDGHGCYLDAFLNKIDIDHSYDQEPFQAGRNVAVTTFFEQASAGLKCYLNFEQIHPSDNYYLGASFDWVPISYGYCSYLVPAYHNFGHYHDSSQIKGRRLQWDPGGFSMMSAWGQAEFQGGRDVRNLSYTCSYSGRSPGPPHGLGPDCERHTTSTWRR